jgi:hypothetical protein
MCKDYAKCVDFTLLIEYLYLVKLTQWINTLMYKDYAKCVDFTLLIAYLYLVKLTQWINTLMCKDYAKMCRFYTIDCISLSCKTNIMDKNINV